MSTRSTKKTIARFMIAVFAGSMTYSVVNPYYLDPLMWYANPPLAIDITIQFMLLVLVSSLGSLVAVGVHSLIRVQIGDDEDECRCRRCGYILKGLSEPKCSECGEPI